MASGDVHMHARGRRALQDTMTAIRHHLPVADAGLRLHPNGERHLRSLDALRELYPAALLDETLNIARRCTFDLGQLRYQYPRELVPEGHSASVLAAGADRAGHAPSAGPTGRAPKVRGLIDKELGLIAELGYESYFLTVQDIVAFARQPENSLSGPGLGGQLGGVFRLGHHRDRP